jgi:putative DNA primase/helicase
MSALDELLKANGIDLKNTRPGRHYTTCPQCSKERSKEHQNAKVLGVTIEGDSGRWGCNHCGWTGPEKGSGAKNDTTELITYVYCDRDGEPRFRKVRNQPGRKPRFWLEQPDGKDGWKKGTKDVDTTLIYRADEVTKAINAGRDIAVVEGEKDVDNLWRIDIPATCNAHSASEVGKRPKWSEVHSAQLAAADIIVFNDNDAAGYAHADAICKLSLGVAKRVRRLDLKDHWPEIKTGGDVSDWLAVEGHKPERLRELIANAAEIEPTPEPGPIDEDAEIERLARLSAFEYERSRTAAAKALGIRAGMLDKLVAAKRAELGLGQKEDNKQGRPVEFPEIEPWGQPVDGVELFDQLAELNYVVMPETSRHANALWVAHAYLLDRFFISPRLAIRSPLPECGKTTLLDVDSRLVPRPLRTDNVSPSALFRVVDGYRPTVLIDEADAFAKDDEALRGILNSGHRRGGYVIRSVGDDFEPRMFATYAATAIACIGTLAATLISRAVVIDLKRRVASEPITEFNFHDTAVLDVLTRKLARWTRDHADEIAEAKPDMSGVSNRTADNWRPLAQIAAVISGHWPERVRTAMLVGRVEAEDASLIETLLGDIRDIFEALGRDRVSSAELIEKLCEITPRPWSEFGKSGKPLTQNKLAKLLKPLGIAPELIRQGEDVARGYRRNQFDEAFERYLSSKEGSSNRYTATNPANTGTSDLFQSVTSDAAVTVRKSQKSNNDGVCDGVTVREGDSGQNDGKGLSIREIGTLADWYMDKHHAHGDEPKVQIWLDAELRRRLREECRVLPEHIEAEFKRVMEQVFSLSDARTRASFDDIPF